MTSRSSSPTWARRSREHSAVSSASVFSLRRSSALAVALVLSVGVAAVAPGSPAGAAASQAAESAAGKPSPKLDWKSCRSEGECAKLTVPLDYEHPNNGKTIKVSLFRLPARDSSRRIGSLLMNPGGPGAPGAAFVRSFASVLPDQIRERFDVIGFDPRGSGGTHPVKCRDNL